MFFHATIIDLIKKKLSHDAASVLHRSHHYTAYERIQIPKFVY